MDLMRCPLALKMTATGLVSVLLLVRCGTAVCDGATADGCGPPVYAYAHVQGRAAYAGGAPITDRDASVACGEAVGVYSDRTDSQGRFEVAPAYAVFDTLLYPFPPREPDGSFLVDCRVSLALSAEQAILERVPVRFAPSGLPLVPTAVELRQAAP